AQTYLPYVEGNPDEFDPGLQAFFRDMAEVRAFYAPFLDNDDETAPPQYDFDVDFRVSLYREVSGSNIIEWQLMVDDRVIGIRDTVRTGSWTYGEPVRLVLRWAKDGPLSPVDAGHPNVRTDVEARRVTFEYLNRWALLAFLDQHRRRPFDPNPITLQFRIPVRPVGAPEQVVPDTSVVFLRMVVRPPGSNEVLDFPTSFPRRVP
ncbi:MAG: hypothetical protein IH820_10605, partial [Bacteroidetes bacterium]|nr:hypothetical protein [Bacteroidota bacterium]